MKNALPAGTDQKSASDAVANYFDSAAASAVAEQTARRFGPTPTVTVDLPTTTKRSTTAKP